jgi:hypothetical protein
MRVATRAAVGHGPEVARRPSLGGRRVCAAGLSPPLRSPRMGAVSGGGLSGEDFELHYHWLVFENQRLKRDGASFQGFSEEIISLHDDTFIGGE